MKGGPAHGICYIILCDMRVSFLKINICVCFTEDMQLLFFFHSGIAKNSSILGCDAVSLAQRPMLYPRRFQSSGKNILNYITTYKT